MISDTFGPIAWVRDQTSSGNHPRLKGVPRHHDDSAPALELHRVTKRYNGSPVVNDLTLMAQRGHVTAVLGPNGAGKTTTIEMCEGLRTPDHGDIRVLGLRPREDRSVLREQVGVMLQDGGLPTSVNGHTLLTHVSRFYADPWPVHDLVERLGLASFFTTSVRRLSGGQRQRIALAAALLGRPQLVFLDEPSAGLDPQSRHAVWDLIRALREQGTSVLLTTHLMDEAEALSDHVVIMDHGTVIAQGSPTQLTAHDASTITFTTATPLDTTVLHADTQITARPHPTLPATWTISQGASAQTLAALAQWCADRGVTLTSTTLGKRTLEDVFLDITGRHLR